MFRLGRTNTQQALEMIRDTVFQQENGDRPDVPNVLIIITDGRPTEQLNTNLDAVVRHQNNVLLSVLVFQMTQI